MRFNYCEDGLLQLEAYGHTFPIGLDRRVTADTIIWQLRELLIDKDYGVVTEDEEEYLCMAFRLLRFAWKQADAGRPECVNAAWGFLIEYEPADMA